MSCVVGKPVYDLLARFQVYITFMLTGHELKLE